MKAQKTFDRTLAADTFSGRILCSAHVLMGENKSLETVDIFLPAVLSDLVLSVSFLETF